MTATTASRQVVLERITGELEQIFASLGPIAAGFADLVDSPVTDRPDGLSRLRDVTFDVLSRHDGLVAGAGAIAAPDALPDSHYWLRWWWTRATGAPEALRVNLDPAAPDFFDYTSADWYRTPLRTSVRHVAGPYVDYACTNEYALTVAVPVMLRNRFVGVAAADVLVSSLERQLLPALRTLSRPAVLLNAGGRVIASTSPQYASGMRVPVPAAPTTTTTTTDASPLGWHLLPA